MLIFLLPGKCIKTPLFTPREVHKNTSFYSPGTARKLGSSENSVHKGAGYIGWLAGEKFLSTEISKFVNVEFQTRTEGPLNLPQIHRHSFINCSLD